MSERESLLEALPLFREVVERYGNYWCKDDAYYAALEALAREENHLIEQATAAHYHGGEEGEAREEQQDGAFEQATVDSFFGFLGEHDADEDRAYRLMGRIRTAVYAALQERYG